MLIPKNLCQANIESGRGFFVLFLRQCPRHFDHAGGIDFYLLQRHCAAVDALQQVQRGSGSSRRAAEQDAAARMLAHLQQSLAQGGEAAHAIVKITRKTTRHARHKPSSQP